MAKKIKLHLSDDSCMILPLVEDKLAHEIKEWLDRGFDIIITRNDLATHTERRYFVYDMEILEGSPQYRGDGREPPAYLQSHAEDLAICFAKPIQRVVDGPFSANKWPPETTTISGRLIITMDIPERSGYIFPDRDD